MTAAAAAPVRGRRPGLYLFVLAGMALGIMLGLIVPETGVMLKPLGDAFVKLLKMVVGPIVFVTVVTGIARLGDVRRLGRLGAKTIGYFMALTSLALVIGMVVANVAMPGASLHIDPASLDPSAAQSYIARAQDVSPEGFLLGIIPDTMVSAFTCGELLQILLVSILVGSAATGLGDRAAPLIDGLEIVGSVLLRILGWIMWLSPVAVCAAMAFTVGSMGLSVLSGLVGLMACFYLTCIVFIVLVLGAAATAAGFNVFRLIGYIRAELLTAFGTASSESVLAPLMRKLERLGAAREVVGLVIPAGYSFNMDGNAIYLTMTVLFLAQALDIPLSLHDQIALLAVALVTSKGSSGVAGSGFVVLVATLAATSKVPVAAVALVLGVDRLMSEARVITNLIGNSVATLVVAAWEGELDREKLKRELRA